MDFSLWLAFAAASMVLCMIPGPTVLLVLAYALLADRMRLAIRRPNVIAWMTRIGGGAVVVMGLATAMVRRTAS